jgi:hypothetical protein
MRQQRIVLAEDTAAQAKELAARWGLPPVRHLSAVVAKAVERQYNAEVAAVNLDGLTFEEKFELYNLLRDAGMMAIAGKLFKEK